MSREESLIKKIVAINEDGAPHDSYMLTILCDIAESLAVIADKLTDEKSISNEVLHKPKNGSDYPVKIMVEDREYIPVVRCKDCKYWRPDTRSDKDIGIKDRDDELWGPGDLCIKHLSSDQLEAIEFGPDEFCNFGKRKK